MIEEKKPKKKESKTSLIKRLREELKEERQATWNRYQEYRVTRDELEFYQKIIEHHFYKIKFKIKANSGNMTIAEEICKGCCPEHAIFKLKQKKTHPHTFELTDIKKLA